MSHFKDFLGELEKIRIGNGNPKILFTPHTLSASADPSDTKVTLPMYNFCSNVTKNVLTLIQFADFPGNKSNPRSILSPHILNILFTNAFDSYRILLVGTILEVLLNKPDLLEKFCGQYNCDNLIINSGD